MTEYIAQGAWAAIVALVRWLVAAVAMAIGVGLLFFPSPRSLA